MEQTERSIEVDRPVSMVYDQWTQFEEFPRFMEGVEEVRQLDDTSLHWVAEIAGKRKEWDAEIVRQEPDRVISWRGFGDPENNGTVEFESLDDGRTQVTVRIEYEPQGAVEKIGDAIGVVDMRVQGDLRRFKEFIEEREVPTGSWRGHVEGGEVADDKGGMGGTSSGTAGDIDTMDDLGTSTGTTGDVDTMDDLGTRGDLSESGTGTMQGGTGDLAAPPPRIGDTASTGPMVEDDADRDEPPMRDVG
jgi:carbon monoxide dehydrogenase subunit G